MSVRVKSIAVNRRKWLKENPDFVETVRWEQYEASRLIVFKTSGFLQYYIHGDNTVETVAQNIYALLGNRSPIMIGRDSIEVCKCLDEIIANGEKVFDTFYDLLLPKKPSSDVQVQRTMLEEFRNNLNKLNFIPKPKKESLWDLFRKYFAWNS